VPSEAAAPVGVAEGAALGVSGEVTHEVMNNETMNNEQCLRMA